MTELSDIQEWIESHYNQHISVYNYGDHIRMTNGSAAHYVDMRLTDGRIELTGERYGRRIEKESKANEDDLIETLRATL